MALNAKKLGAQPETLAKALCRLLAHIAKKHQRQNNNVSVATTLESNQRRSIIRMTPSEQPEGGSAHDMQSVQNNAMFDSIPLGTTYYGRAIRRGRACQQACEEARAEAQGSTWQPIKKRELMKAIAKCKIQKSPGPDQIPYEVWKMMPVGVLYRVARLFDQFVIQNKTPARWDTAKGIPLFKKGDETDAYMYRIISLTDTLSKIYERIIELRP